MGLMGLAGVKWSQEGCSGVRRYRGLSWRAVGLIVEQWGWVVHVGFVHSGVGCNAVGSALRSGSALHGGSALQSRLRAAQWVSVAQWAPHCTQHCIQHCTVGQHCTQHCIQHCTVGQRCTQHCTLSTARRFSGAHWAQSCTVVQHCPAAPPPCRLPPWLCPPCSFDLATLPVDFVECLMRFVPTEAEVKALRQYERERKPLEELSAEDRFMLHFSKVERLPQRMAIMAFLGNFADNLQMLTPVLGPGGDRAALRALRRGLRLLCSAASACMALHRPHALASRLALHCPHALLCIVLTPCFALSSCLALHCPHALLCMPCFTSSSHLALRACLALRRPHALSSCLALHALLHIVLTPCFACMPGFALSSCIALHALLHIVLSTSSSHLALCA